MDWDLDGRLDILSGCYSLYNENGGALQLLRGKTSTDFYAAETMVDEEGEQILNVAVAKDADFLSKYKNFCTHQHAVDYDNDGDLDLVVGSGKDEIRFHENVAAQGQVPKIASSAASLSVRLPFPVRGPNPHLADWDNDGDLDLLCGSSAGGVFIAENSGSRSEPEYNPFKILIPLSESKSRFMYQRVGDPEIQLGGATRIWVTDFNSDGVKDLLIGDRAGLYELAKGVTEIEFKEALSAFDDGRGESGLDECVVKKQTGFVWVFLQKSRRP